MPGNPSQKLPFLFTQKSTNMRFEIEYHHICQGCHETYSDVDHHCPNDPNTTCSCCDGCFEKCKEEAEANEEESN